MASAVLLGSSLALGVVAPASAQGDRDRIERMSLLADGTDTALESDNIAQLSSNPSQVGISGCFMKTAPIFVTSGLDSVRVYDVGNAARPRLVGTLPNVLFENEAMNCGERRTSNGVRRFVLIGVDLVNVNPSDIAHTNVGGGELIVVDVTNPARPRILSRAEGSTSTHTVACVQESNCTYAYSAGSGGKFSVFDLRNLSKPVEVDKRRKKPGLQAFSSPTAGHKWNFDAAWIGTHTGFGGASMWSTKNPARPKLIVTTGKAGEGTDPRFPGYNDFILHNSFRPNAKKFKPNKRPSLSRGNVLLITEEDYEQTDCSRAGSFQTWWVKRLSTTKVKGKNGKRVTRKPVIVPLDKVELSDLGTFPLPQGAFCSSHWFDYRPGGLVAAGFYGGGTQILDVRNPRNIKTYAHSVHGLSEVWDAMWVPVFTQDGKQTKRRTNVVYSIDLVRGLDVYAVDVPGDGRGALPPNARTGASFDRSGAIVPLGLVGGAMGLALGLRRRRRTPAV